MPAGTITANGNYPTVPWVSIQKPGNANAQLHLSGTFDSATVQVQFKADGADDVGPAADGWLDINGGAYTAADDDIINLPNARTIRLKVTGGGGSMDIDYDLY